ncbi:MAG: sigma-54 dependent transcriptional regulator [Alistipes putredinis]|nr:MAG: sigma-54 dependent transcriptional regulator [Alistipes putredinis]
MTSVLVIDSSRAVRNILRERLEYEGFDVRCIDKADATLNKGAKFDAVISDSTDAGKFGFPMIVTSADSSVEYAMDCVHKGAVDFLPKPIDMNRLLASLRGICEKSQREPAPVQTVLRPAKRKSAFACGEIIGGSEQIMHVKSLIAKVAPSEARVLVVGANGTGKELVARHLHEQSKRSGAPFVEINCAAIPSELIESELFGHEKGAFTSAIKQRKGKFEQADGGTLFMDEVGDMSLSAQAKVLRALQEKRISRVGSDRDMEVDVRVIAATNKDLRREIAEGRFREDLYHRLSVIVIRVPPLRDRLADIPMLVEHFNRQICEEYGIEPKMFSDSALGKMLEMPWTGNVRELRNVVERLIILGGQKITEYDVQTYACGVL